MCWGGGGGGIHIDRKTAETLEKTNEHEAHGDVKTFSVVTN